MNLIFWDYSNALRRKEYKIRMKRNQKIVAIALLVVFIIAGMTTGTILNEKNIVKAAGITVHFKWEGETPHIYYQNVNGDGKTSISWPGIPMKVEGNNWYCYTIKDIQTADIIFSDSSVNYQTIASNRESGEYWFDQGTWYSQDPDISPRLVQENKKPSKLTNKSVQTVNQLDTQMLSSNNEKGITVHFVSEWSSANIYYWNTLPKNEEIEWPGEQMSKDSSGYYTYEFPNASKINLLFSNGKEQTEDLTLKTGEWWYQDGNWTNYDPADAPTPTPKPSVKPFTRTDFRDETIYFLMTTRFYDGDKGNNAHCRADAKAGNGDDDPAWRGDFKGLIEKLDYIKALGFSAVWITPVVQNDSDYDYHGYHAYNFKKVDSRYESSDVSYQDLINAVHAKGMKVVQDIVLNHTCNYGEENLHQINKGMSSDDRVASIASSSGDPNYIYHHDGYTNQWESYQVQTGHLAKDCIDLNTENPKVYNYLIDAYNGYINMGVDAFRVDTVKHISRLNFNNTFLPAFKETGGDNFYMFGETCVRRNEIWNGGLPGISVSFYTWKETENYAWGDTDTNIASVAKHFTDQSGDKQPKSDNYLLKNNTYRTPDRSQASGLDQIDFYMHWGFVNAQQAFQRGLEEDPYFNDSTWSVTYVDSHDYAPDTAPEDQRFTGTQDTWAENLDLMFTFRGIPCIYYGSEIEFKKGMPIDEGTDAPLERSGRAYFGSHIEGSINTSDFGVYSNATGKMAESLDYPLAKHIQRLNLIRRAVPALRKGQYSTEGVNGGLAFKRRYTDSQLDSFACVAISGSATFTGIPSGEYVELITGKKVSSDGTLTTDSVEKGNMRIYVLQTSGAVDGKVGEDGTYLKAN